MQKPSWTLLGGGALILVAIFGVGHEVHNAWTTYGEYSRGIEKQQQTMLALEPLDQATDFDIVLAMASQPAGGPAAPAAAAVAAPAASPSLAPGLAVASATPKPLTELSPTQLAQVRAIATRYSALHADKQAEFMTNLAAWFAMTPFQREAARLAYLKSQTH